MATPGAASDRVTDWVPTGHWPYDYGYGMGRIMLMEQELMGQPSSTCAQGSQALIDGGVLTSQILIDTYRSGCADAYNDRPPDHSPQGDYGPPP